MGAALSRQISLGPASAGFEAVFLAAASHPQCIAFVDYWRSCARGSLPSRSDFEPRRIARWLPHFVVMEMRDGAIRYRLVGSKLEEWTSTSAQGRFIGEIFSRESTLASEKLFRHTLDVSAPVILRARFTGMGIESLAFEVAQAPIFAPDRKDMWVVGCMYALEDAG